MPQIVGDFKKMGILVYGEAPGLKYVFKGWHFELNVKVHDELVQFVKN